MPALWCCSSRHSALLVLWQSCHAIGLRHWYTVQGGDRCRAPSCILKRIRLNVCMLAASVSDDSAGHTPGRIHQMICHTVGRDPCADLLPTLFAKSSFPKSRCFTLQRAMIRGLWSCPTATVSLCHPFVRRHRARSLAASFLCVSQSCRLPILASCRLLPAAWKFPRLLVTLCHQKFYLWIELRGSCASADLHLSTSQAPTRMH